MRKTGIILFLILSIFTACGKYAKASNAGFVSANTNIWYSKDPFEEGDIVKIYTIIFNPDKRELSGTVSFFDKTVFLGKKNFTVPANGVKDISVNWTATVGDHSIFGKIEGARFLVSANKYEDVYLNDGETEKSNRAVSKKIIPAKDNPTTNTDTSDKINNTSLSSIENIQQIIKEGTPDFIAKPISSTANAIDGFREGVGAMSENKKELIKAELVTLNNNNTSTKANTSTSSILKPFKYIEIFFLGLFSFIFNNKFMFYGLLAIIIFFLVRFIWRKIF